MKRTLLDAILQYEVRSEQALKIVQTSLARIEQKLDIAEAQEEKLMAALDDQIAALTAQVQANTTVEQSAKTMISGFAAQLAAAITAAQAAGATTAQLKSLSDLNTAIKSSDDDLAAAIAANTPSA